MSLLLGEMRVHQNPGVRIERDGYRLFPARDFEMLLLACHQDVFDP
jgi:hypothetical protein